MATHHSDALVFFGATGDLAHKKIFPALPAMVLERSFPSRSRQQMLGGYLQPRSLGNFASLPHPFPTLS
jgi:glucose-6-phosphate 1-dehydrogenase